MDDTKRVIDLEKAREELEQSKQAIDDLARYENMTYEELTETAFVSMAETMGAMREVIELNSKSISRLLDVIKENQEHTTNIYTDIYTMVEKIENDLMEQGIFVGSYNLDDID